MHCPKCGSFNSDSSHACSKCGAPLAKAPSPRDGARDASKRKTVQMPSYQNAAEQRKAREEERKRTSTNSKPWENRVPTRQERTASAKRASKKPSEQAAAAGVVSAAGTAGVTGRIPRQSEQIKTRQADAFEPKQTDALKPRRADAAEIDDVDNDIPKQTEYQHPIQEPVHEPAEQASVRYMSPEQQELLREASFKEQEVQEEPKQEQLFIDETQDAIKSAAAATMATSTIQRQTPTRRRIVKEKKSSKIAINKSGKKSSNKGLIVVLVVVLLAVGIGGGWFFLNNNTKSKIVSFDTNGGTSMSERSVPENGQLQIPTPPTREGYTFEGWYLDAAYTEPAEFPLTITDDITLYAKWSANSGTGGSSSTSSSSSSSSSASSSPADNTATDSSGTSSGAGYSESDYSDSYYSGGGSSSDDDSDDDSGDDSGESGGRDYDSTADVYVIASDGTPLSGTVRLTDGFVIPDSSEHAYSMSELRALGLSDAELCIAWNEPFARLGYDFDNSGLQSYFDSCGWYSNSSSKPSLAPGSAAEITVRNLQRIARESSSSAAWLYLSTD